MDKERSKLTTPQQLSASTTGAIVTSIFVTPLDVVKIRLQTQQKALLSNKCFLYCNGLMDHLCPCVNGNGSPSSAPGVENWYRRPSHFSGTLDAFVKIVRFEGVRSLWSGLPPTLVMAVPATASYFTCYEKLNFLLRKKFPLNQNALWIPMLAGGIARTGAATLISPLELIRTKMQSKRLSYKEVGFAIRILIQHEGVRALWKGLGPTILRDVPFSCLYWVSYEYLKAKFHQPQPTFFFSFIAGASAGTIAAVLTLPFDVVKTHRQIELGEKEIYTVDNPKKSKNTYFMLQKLYRQNGIPGLFTGLAPRVAKVAPACAIMISTYEYGKSFFHQYNETRI